MQEMMPPRIAKKETSSAADEFLESVNMLAGCKTLEEFAQLGEFLDKEYSRSRTTNAPTGEREFVDYWTKCLQAAKERLSNGSGQAAAFNTAEDADLGSAVTLSLEERARRLQHILGLFQGLGIEIVPPQEITQQVLSLARFLSEESGDFDGTDLFGYRSRDLYHIARAFEGKIKKPDLIQACNDLSRYLSSSPDRSNAMRTPQNLRSVLSSLGDLSQALRNFRSGLDEEGLKAVSFLVRKIEDSSIYISSKLRSSQEYFDRR